MPAGDDHAGGGAGRFAVPPGRVAILVVDDDPYFCESVARVLGATPLVPFSVDTGVAAFRFLDRDAGFEDAPCPAIIVLDFDLPDMKAPGVLARLRADPRHSHIPVIVLTALARPDRERAVLQAGAQA